ncbi:MAG: selenium-dependent molybdenum cofactor biosynthesis protein YqeB [Deferribacterales bacterium]
MEKILTAVRGGGDIATGVIYRLKKCGFDVVILECAKPSAIRRTVSLCMAVYDGRAQVEDLTAVLTDTEHYRDVLNSGSIPVIIDPDCASLEKIKPDVLVDAVIAKRNLGTRIDMAPFTVALGCGFTAGADVHAVVETRRGHTLGRVIYSGEAAPNTGTPGEIGGKSAERVIYSPYAGKIKVLRDIGSVVREGETIAIVGDAEIKAPFDGLVRGMIQDGYETPVGMKIADVDVRKTETGNALMISDKALAVGGGVVEAVMGHLRDRIWTE